jgi:tetratricopeptide (TPR) repeat protein
MRAASRAAALRTDLASAATAAECVPPLAGLIEIASELRCEGGGGAENARPILDEVLVYLRAARARPSAEGRSGVDETAAVLYLEAEACLLRDAEVGPVSDLDNAIECLRRLRAMLPDDTDERTEADAKLVSAALTRAGRAGGSLADIDEAGVLLDGLLDRAAPGDPALRQVVRGLAVQRGLRFISFGGSDEDRMAGIGYAQKCLTLPAPDGPPDDTADISHLMIAWLTLTRQLTAAQRSAAFRRAEVESARHGGEAAAALLAQLGSLVISPDDARVALDHLHQMSAALTDEGMRGVKFMVWAMALLVSREEGPGGGVHAEGELRYVADELDRAAALTPQDAAELLTARAALLALDAQTPEGATPLAQASDALHDAAVRLPAGHPARVAGLSLLSSRLQGQVNNAGTAADPVASLDEVMRAMDRMPSDDPDFAQLRTAIGVQALGLGTTRRSVAADDRIAAQLDQAIAGLGPNEPLRAFAEMVSLGASGLRGTLQQEPDRLNSAIDRLRALVGSRPAGDPLRTFGLSGIAFALCDRHSMRGEIRDLEEADDCVRQVFESVAPDGPFAEGTSLHGGLLYLRAHLELMWCYYSQAPDLARLDRAIADLERAARVVGESQPLEVSVSSELRSARALREMVAAGGNAIVGPVARDAFAGILQQAQSLDADHPGYPALLSQAAAGLALSGLADNNLQLIDQAITLLGDACAVPGLAVRERPWLLAAHGYALLTRHFRRNSPRDLSNAIGRLEEARRAVDQETGSPYAANVLLTLAAAYRTRGDAARGDVNRAVTYGLAGLREHAGDVLLQDNDDRALHVARRGRDDATEMARWFLDHGREAAAVGAIELGRGVVLHAATSGADVEEALRLAGETELAGKWSGRSRGDRDPSADADLRYLVMLAIERSPAEARLLSPPAVGDITEALAVSGADVLVYLLAGESGVPGLAVLVARGKGVRRLLLPGMVADGSSPAARFSQTRRAADGHARALEDLRARKEPDKQALLAAIAAAEEAAGAWAGTLDPLCEWAWRVAIGPVLDALRERDGSRELRIVLSPGGELGLIPWHAAREPGTGRYACQRAVFSYASSARQFIDAVRCQPQPWGQDPVLISDQRHSDWLPVAGIRGLFAEHYQAGAVYGWAREKLPGTVPGDKTATSATVLAALPGSGTDGASMLHFGCHGRAEVPVLHSRIRLGDDYPDAESDGKLKENLLRVGDILRQARVWRSGQHAAASSCGLVVLASCLSDVTNADYDEALTLATAFLSAGVGGVVAARWRVTASTTALLMAAFHQYLNTGADPARALRDSQLWMLDPARDIPGHWPRELRAEAELAGDPDGPDLVSPAAWAGFAYQGR